MPEFNLLHLTENFRYGLRIHGCLLKKSRKINSIVSPQLSVFKLMQGTSCVLECTIKLSEAQSVLFRPF